MDWEEAMRREIKRVRELAERADSPDTREKEVKPVSWEEAPDRIVRQNEESSRSSTALNRMFEVNRDSEFPQSSPTASRSGLSSSGPDGSLC